MPLTLESRVRLVLCLLAVAGACTRPAAPAPPVLASDAGSVADAGPPPDAGPLAIPGARLFVQLDEAPLGVRPDGGPLAGEASADGGAGDAGVVVASVSAAPLDLTQPGASLPDTAEIRFTAAVPLEDARFRLLTLDDRFVPNRAEVTLADGGTRVTLTPTPFWPARGCCRFVVDGELEHLPTGGGGRYLPFEAQFSVAANPARLEAAKVATARQREHHKRRHR